MIKKVEDIEEQSGDQSQPLVPGNERRRVPPGSYGTKSDLPSYLKLSADEAGHERLTITTITGAEVVRDGPFRDDELLLALALDEDLSTLRELAIKLLDRCGCMKDGEGFEVNGNGIHMDVTLKSDRRIRRS